MPQDRDLTSDGDHRARGGAKAIHSALNNDFDAAERVVDIYRMLLDLTERMTVLEGKIDAIIRRGFVDRSGLSVQDRLRVDRFPAQSPSDLPGLLVSLFSVIGSGGRRLAGIGCGENGGTCAFFAAELGWRGVLADANASVVQELEARYQGTGATPVAWMPTPADMDAFLAERGLSPALDLLSLETNGPDFWLWEAMTVCRPRVVVLAYNSAFGPASAVTTPYAREFDAKSLKGADRLYFGASLGALTRLSARKGYRLIAVAGSGEAAAFLRDDVAPEIPGQRSDHAFRWAPKHRRQVLKIGDAVSYFKDRGLPLTTIE